jgi:hypothetical protein
VTTASVIVSSVQKELAEERRAVKALVEGDGKGTCYTLDAEGLRKGSMGSPAPETEKGARRARTAQSGRNAARSRGAAKRPKGAR